MASDPTARVPGILYYDPNPTTAKLALATLRLDGYDVFHAASKDEAIALYEAHGVSADGQRRGNLVALLLDASVDARISAAILRAIVQLPGASELAGILIVGKSNPNPIPGVEGLPGIRRPFSSPALLRIVGETLASHDHKLPAAATKPTPGKQRTHRLAKLLSAHFPEIAADEKIVGELLADLDADPELPRIAPEVGLHTRLTATRLEAVLEMLGSDGASGVLLVQRDGQPDGEWGRLHLQGGRVRLAEYGGGAEDLKLGRFVVEGGYLSDAELEAYIVGRDPKGRPLGTRLVEAGILTRETLARVLVAQAREVTCVLLTWKAGTISFHPSDELHPLAKAAAEETGVELLVAEALLDGLRRVDEQALMGPMGPHMGGLEDVYMRIDEQIARIGRDGFAREELQVLELSNGRNSVKEIARRTRVGTFAVAKILYRLDKANVVRRRVLPISA
jgi:CheY-like chemotaxis protein